jgi:phage baseplate assembly protein W
MATNAIDESRFGRDLYVPLDPDEPLRVSPTGDLATIAGYKNLTHAMEAMALTTPGDLVFRPDYGGGLVEEVEAPGTPGSRARAANRLRRSALADTRVQDAEVGVAPGIPGDGTRTGAVTATLNVKPKGDTSTFPIIVTAE